MDILSFNKITKPKYEGESSIDLKPRGMWKAEVRRTDGTTRYPLGDIWIPNVFLTSWADAQLTTQPTGNTPGSSWGWASGLGGVSGAYYTILDFFFNRSTIAVGSGTNPASAANTILQTEVRSDSTLYPSGNSASWDLASGNLTWTVKREFPTESTPVTYNEAGIKLGGVTATTSTWINGLTTSGSSRLINRVVFPAPVSLLAGEKLIITMSVTIPSLASSAGKTITIAAQNGVNISGILKHVSGSNTMLGGAVTSSGVVTRTGDGSTPLYMRNQLIPQVGSFVIPTAVITADSTFFTLGTDPNWSTGTFVQGAWGAYTPGSRTRDLAFQWSSGVPAANTIFRSILFRTGGPINPGSNNRGGYQLLLDNEMTKASTATLTVSLRFTI